MKKVSKTKAKAKKGAASIYVVVFVTLLFSVITVTFVRVILSNSSNTTNNDLSQSAYDAALSGVEDAKKAIEQYAICKNDMTTRSDCGTIVDKFEKEEERSCDTVKSILYGTDDDGTEVLIRENISGSEGGTDEIQIEDEAYTCVTITPNTTDYKSTLSAANPVRVIRLKATSAYDTIKISWHSDRDGSSFVYSDNGNGKKFDSNANSVITPAIISASLIYPRSDAYTDFDDVPHSTMFMIPDSNANTGNITEAVLSANSNQDPADGYEPFAVKCNSSNVYACEEKIVLSSDMPSGSETDFLILALPYGQPDTDFSITLYKGANKVNFDRVQYAVDSTGRANDVYRRVESRVEANDNYFPYPEFAIELSSTDVADVLEKYFYVTKDCQVIDNGMKKTDCHSSQRLSD